MIHGQIGFPDTATVSHRLDTIPAGFYQASMSSHPRTLPAGFIAPCLPTKAPTPSGAEWLHEIKHDGFRVIARKEGKRVKGYSHPAMI